jgi:hypothetical protein
MTTYESEEDIRRAFKEQVSARYWLRQGVEDRALRG